MKIVKSTLAVASTALLVLGLSGMALAFHSGGVAECEGCHSMHSAQSGALLTKSDIGSTCLNCHEKSTDTGPNNYHISTAGSSLGAGAAPLQRTPGGDFGWIKKTFSWLGRDGVTTEYEYGKTHGHNIIAADNGYTEVDGATAPGGTFPADMLSCTSCHDMHGQYRRLSDGTIAKTGAPIIGSGSYHNSKVPAAGEAVGVFRLLAGQDYYQVGTGVTFHVDPPAAVTNSGYNKSEAANQIHTAYGQGMALWCATCHTDMHSTSGNLTHPVDQPLGADLGNYNSYVKSGDLTGSQATSFQSLVPYEEGHKDYGTLMGLAANTAKSQPGPASDSTTVQVMCLSCHRAHASGFANDIRWNYAVEFIVYNGLYPGTDNTSSKYALGRTAAEMQAAYYDRPASDFATYQRMLCNKCHAKD